jgi:5-methylthioadenosine/S-adenosylhomocysteine deaminase
MGSDNMAEDMVEVMRTGLFAERVRRNAQMDPQPEDVLEWATIGGANILGLGQQTGSLEVGKKADLFIVDTLKAHLVPNLRIVSGFVHNGHPGDVTGLMVDGQWVMRDGKILTVDEADVLRRAEQVGVAVWRRLVAQYPNVPFPITLPPHGAE